LDEYNKALEDNPLEASQMLVSIRWGQFMQLKNNGRAHEEDDSKIKLVDADYNSEFGLDLRRN
jgi:hypothetical protein